MEAKDYIKNALVTETSDDYAGVSARLTEKRAVRLLHSALGVATEGGELADVVKKHIFYGKAIDEVHLKEEVGDVLWYLAVLLNELGLSFEDVMAANVAKLRARYGDKFTQAAALQRDLPFERKALEDA